MASPESRPAKFRNLRNVLTTVAAVGIFAACSSSEDSKGGDQISITVEKHASLIVAGGEALITRTSKGEFLVLDKPDGLAPKDSIPLVKDFMKERGCDITDAETLRGENNDAIGEFVEVSNPQDCLPELE